MKHRCPRYRLWMEWRARSLMRDIRTWRQFFAWLRSCFHDAQSAQDWFHNVWLPEAGMGQDTPFDKALPYMCFTRRVMASLAVDALNGLDLPSDGCYSDTELGQALCWGWPLDIEEAK